MDMDTDMDTGWHPHTKTISLGCVYRAEDPRLEGIVCGVWWREGRDCKWRTKTETKRR